MKNENGEYLGAINVFPEILLDSERGFIFHKFCAITLVFKPLYGGVIKVVVESDLEKIKTWKLRARHIY